MVDLKKLQKRVYQNKVKKGFNVTDVPTEFSLLHEEVSEAFRAFRKKLPDLPEELADIAIYLLGLSEILGIDLEKEILRKIEINEKRVYKKINGTFVRIDNNEKKSS